MFLYFEYPHWINNSAQDPFASYGDQYEPVDLFGSKRPAPVEDDEPKPSKSIRFDSDEPNSFGLTDRDSFKITRTINAAPSISGAKKGDSSNPFGAPVANPFGTTSGQDPIFQNPAMIPKRAEKRSSPSPDPVQSSAIASFMKKKGDSRKVFLEFLKENTGDMVIR